MCNTPAKQTNMQRVHNEEELRYVAMDENVTET